MELGHHKSAPIRMERNKLMKLADKHSAAHGREVPNVSLRRGFGGSKKDRRKQAGWSRLFG